MNRRANPYMIQDVKERHEMDSCGTGVRGVIAAELRVED